MWSKALLSQTLAFWKERGLEKKKKCGYGVGGLGKKQKGQLEHVNFMRHFGFLSFVFIFYLIVVCFVFVFRRFLIFIFISLSSAQSVNHFLFFDA